MNRERIKMAKMKIVEIVERWNDEKPEGLLMMSKKQKDAAFADFCKWNGIDITRLADYFTEYAD